MPPAKRVKVVARNAKPVPILMTMRNPGVYSLYVTSSSRWAGRETHLKKSDQPINLASFCIPEKLFLTKDGEPLVDEVNCDEVRLVDTTSSDVALRWLFADCASCVCVRVECLVYRRLAFTLP